MYSTNNPEYMAYKYGCGFSHISISKMKIHKIFKLLDLLPALCDE
jgi:hypothetical protein